MNNYMIINEIQKTDTIYMKSGNTTVEVVAHFSEDRTYEDIIKAAIQREFSN